MTITLSTTIITFAPAQSTASFEVSIKNDFVFQPDRILSLSINPLDDNSMPGRDSVAVITVTNDDAEISLTTLSAENPLSVSVTEGSDLSATLQLNINPVVDRILPVNLSYTGDVGALAGALSSTVIMVPANTATYEFDVDIEDNQITAEGTRIVTVQLLEASLEFDYLVSNTDNTAVEISVADDDVAEVYFSPSTGTVTEGQDIVFIITKNLIAATETSVNIEFTPIGKFFKMATATTQVNFPAGGVAMSTAKIVIQTEDDKNVETDGSLRANIVRIEESPLQLGTPTESIVTILDNDVPAVIRFELAGYDISEGTTGTIILRADPSPGIKTQIMLTTGMETTIEEDDYSLSETIITFVTDQSTASFEVSIEDDNDVQETRELRLSLVPLDSNSISGTVSETVISIGNNDESTASLGVVGDVRDTIRLAEGSNVTLRVTLDLAFDRATTIQIVTTGTATLGDDYTINGNLVELSAYSTYAETTLRIIDDNLVEPEETIRLTLNADHNEQIIGLGAPITLTIADNDVPAISFERAEYTITEGTTNTIILVADQLPIHTAEIELTTTTTTFSRVIEGVDYELSPETVVFNPGKSTASFVVKIFDDKVVQSTREFSLLFGDLMNAEPGTTPKTVISVGDNDISIASLEVEGADTLLEGGDDVTLRVTLDLAFDRETTIQIVTTGTATLGDDYTINGNLVELSAYSTYAETTLTIIDDMQIEPDETIILTLEAANNQIRDDEPGAQLTLTIDDNDVPAISFEQAEYTIFEGTTGRITLVAEPRVLEFTLIRLTTSTTTVSGMIENDDYEILSGDDVVGERDIRFRQAQMEASFEVSIVNNNILQETRKLFVSFFPSMSGSITRGAISTATIIIPDNAAPIASLEVVRDDLRLEERGSDSDSATLRVTLDRTFEDSVTIQIVTTGTATLGEDYTITVNPVELSANSTYVETILEVIGDVEVEPEETIILTLAANNNRIIDDLDLVDREPLTLTIEDNNVLTEISLIIPFTLIESTNEVIGSTMRNVKHGEPFPVYIRVDTFADIPDSLLILDGPQDGALPTTLMISALGAGETWSELFVGNSTTTAVGQQNYRYCLAGTQNCSSTISVSYSSPAIPGVDVDDEIGSEWDFTLSEQTATPAGCRPTEDGTFPTLLSQEGNAFTSTSPLPEIPTYTGIVDGNSYSLAYRDPNFNVGTNVGTYIDTHATRYSSNPVTLFGLGVWWWTDRAGFLCRGTYNIVYTPRPHIDSIAVASTSVSEDVGNVVVTVTLTYPPVQSVAATLEIEGTATDADDYQVEQDISFVIGETQTTLNLVIIDDSLAEPDETIILTAVSQDPSKLVGASSTALTIEDNEPVISLRAPGSTRICRPPPTPASTPNCRIVVTEDDHFARLQLDASRLTATTLTVNLLYTGDAGALDGGLPSDSTDSFTTVTVAINTTSHPFEVGVINDEIAAEFTRAAHVVLQPGDGYTVDPDNTTVEVAVMDDDFAEVYFSQDAGSITEGSTIVFIITRDLMTAIETPVDIEFIPTGDFFTTTPMTTRVSFPAGVVLSTAKITIPTVDDKDIEADGSLTASIVIIPGSPLRPGDPDVRIVTILNDDVPSVISFDPAEYTIVEGTTGIITLVADPPPGITIQIELTTHPGTTISNLDYQLPTPNITFKPGQSRASFKVSIRARDGFQETVRELHLSFNLLDTTNSIPGAAPVAVINIEDDSAPIASLEIVEGDSDLEESESDSVTLRVRLNRVFDQETTIQIVTTGTATLGDDYTIGGTGDNQVVTLLRDSTYAETTLVVIDDFEVEPNETIILTLDAHDDRIIDDTDLFDREPLTLTIADNDVLNASLAVMGDDIRLEEGANVTLRVTLDSVFYQDTTIQIVITGTATTEDYTIDVNPVELLAGEISVETTLVVIDDTLVEPDETIILTLEANNKQIIIDDESSANTDD